MAEAEDVITDAARHATIFIRDIWRQHRKRRGPAHVEFIDVAQRLDLLIDAVFGRRPALKISDAVPPPTWLARMFHRHLLPGTPHPLPATDGHTLWLPPHADTEDWATGLNRYRAMALLQAVRIHRDTVGMARSRRLSPLQQGVYLLLESGAAERDLLRLLPGLRPGLRALRSECLRNRPRLETIPSCHVPLERLARAALADPEDVTTEALPRCATAAASADAACELATRLAGDMPLLRDYRFETLYKDWWTGRLVLARGDASALDGRDESGPEGPPPRSARMPRRPELRQTRPDEDDGRQGPLMVQPSEPIEQAEDPMGLQRPIDLDDKTPPDELADALSELPEARLVHSPGRPKEVLLSNDPPDSSATKPPVGQSTVETGQFTYPEWDYRAQAYRNPGTTVRVSLATEGPQAWVDETLERHRSMLAAIRHRFEMLRPERVRLYRQLDGEDIDLEAWVQGRCDAHAGLAMPQAIYAASRAQRRDMAIMLLIDVSGSTDSWLSASRRVIDVEREALLLVCTALEGLGQPYSVQAFSGEGPGGVALRSVKAFDEEFGTHVKLRIAGLEPERYTRSGAALRHASHLLTAHPAQHRLLLLLSDGKPNDADDYEGRYGIEDTRQAVVEACAQGIYPFCLTIDRQAAVYLPRIFGSHRYALLPRPELLPAILLDWMRKLVAQQ